MNHVTLNSVVGLVPMEQHAKDGERYRAFHSTKNFENFVTEANGVL